LQGLDRHRFAVGEPEPLDHQDLLARGDMEEPAEPRARELALERESAAAWGHASAAHVLAERGHRQLLRDLRVLDVRATAAPADDIALPGEVVQGGPDGQAGDAEIGGELPLGGDGIAHAEALDQVEHLLARDTLLRHALGSGRSHGPATIPERVEIGQCHCAPWLRPV